MEIPPALLQFGIDRGTILLSDSFEDIDHAKFFVIIGINGDKIAGFFFINSRVHPIIMGKQEAFSLQYPLRKSDYSFLHYDSFLGANEVHTRSVSALSKSMEIGQTSIVGFLTEGDLNAVLEACRNSPLFSEAEKREFFY